MMLFNDFEILLSNSYRRLGGENKVSAAKIFRDLTLPQEDQHRLKADLIS